MRAVYFKNIKDEKRFIGVGEVISIIHSCYFRAKELGYEKIFIEWPLVVYLWDDIGNYTYCIYCPKNTILPIEFMPKGTRLAKNVEIKGLDEFNMLFDGSDPLIMHDPPPNFPPFEYLNKYYIENNIYPIIKIEKEKVDKYVLFHLRKTKVSRGIDRNSNIKDFLSILNLLKDKYPNYKYYKIGEETEIDEKFDKCFSYFNEDINELFKLVNNTSLFIGCSSGPMTLAYMLDIPTIIIDEGSYDLTKNSKSPRYEPFWKKQNRRWGKNGYEWLNYGRNMIIKREDNVNLDDVYEFSGKFL